MNPLLLTTRSVSLLRVSRGSPSPSTMNCKRPSPRTSRALAPGVKRIVRSAFGRSVGPTDELTATIQSPLDERRASFVLSMVDGWGERTDGWPSARKLELKGTTGQVLFIIISFFV